MSIKFNLTASLLNTQNLTKQLQQQLQGNPALKNALKAAQTGTSTGSGMMDNIANQLASVINTNNPDSGTATSLLENPVANRILAKLSPSTANRLRGFLGDLDPQTAGDVADILNNLDAPTVTKLVNVVGSLKPADIDKGIRFLKTMFSRDDRLFYQNENKDLYLNAQNSKKVSGADLDNFMRTAYNVYNRGQDFGKFVDASLEVMEKGDYDDFRRFLSVTDTALYYGEDVEAFYALSSKILNQPAVEGDYKNYAGHYDYEAVAFGLQTTLLNGGKMSDYMAITNNLKMTGLEGRNNLVDFNRIIVDWRNRGGYTPCLFSNLAKEANKPNGNVRGWMNDYMALKGLADTAPDFNKFARIERIDSPAMTIKKGESAALFAQAISTQDGLLPERVMYWSSLEQGALDHGSNYLDLSKLSVGVHHICVKIGGYGGGTDTALKTVIVEPADETEKIHDDNGHGNDPGNVDPSNPGNSKPSVQTAPPPNNGGGETAAGPVTSPSAPPVTTGRGANRGSGGETAAGPVIVAAPAPVARPPAPPVVAELVAPPVVPLPPARPPEVTNRGFNRGAAATAASSATPAASPEKQACVADTKKALAAISEGKSLKEISDMLNAKYYKNLDKVVGLNQSYIQDVRRFIASNLTEKRDKADAQLTQALNILLNAVQAI